MKAFIKAAAALLVGVTALGVTAASADRGDRDRGRDRDRDRYSDSRHDRDDSRDRRASYDSRDRRDGRGHRPDRCTLSHDHRTHHRDYYNYYPKDRYYRADPGFSVSLSVGNRGYYDGRDRYYNRPYYDRRGYRDAGRVLRRDRYRIPGYRADAILIEEAYNTYDRGGRRGYDNRRGNVVCTVVAQGPDSRYVPRGQLRRIAARHCSRRSDIRIYA
ncbi:MAG: hypothetical protein KDA46_03590 [Parvularculaceae bacterium]|nr:hypothetical protein [Parvularculaceae bacterium]